MSKKYVIEIKPEYEDRFKGLMILGAKDSELFVDALAVENLEELNSDYVNENFGGLQDDAYQRGLDDAWEAARKLFSSMADSDIEKVFPTEWNNGGFKALINLQPQKVIEKLKAYEEKQKADEEIKVGDEVKWNSDLIVVTRLYEAGGFDWCGGISKDGSVFQVLAVNVRKTGRHFDIESILEDMRE